MLFRRTKNTDFIDQKLGELRFERGLLLASVGLTIINLALLLVAFYFWNRSSVVPPSTEVKAVLVPAGHLAIESTRLHRCPS